MHCLEILWIPTILDRKSCANIEDHVDESAYNAAAFYWDAKVNAKVQYICVVQAWFINRIQSSIRFQSVWSS
jgi:hypothetical protein